MNTRYLKLALFVFATVFAFTSCEKDDQIKLDAQAESWKIDGISSTSAELSGMVVAQGAGIDEYGVVWSTQENPSLDNNKKVADEVEGAVYWVTVDGLEHLTKYYYKAYVIQSDGTPLYGEQKMFTTLANIATVTIGAAENVADRMVDLSGSVPYDGKADVTARGFCWAEASMPTTANDTTFEGTGTGDFARTLQGLMPNTTYYVRAYAVNKMGTAYSSEVSFTTLKGLAVVKTMAATAITKTNATLNGEIIHDGGTDVTERGFVYGLTENPTVADTKVMDTNTGVGVISADLTGLEPGVKYHVRVYAINSDGVSYGENVPFETVPNIITWYVPGGYVAASYPVGDYANWSPESSPYIQNTLAVGDKLEGYVYMAGASNEWKFATDNSWSENYGDDGADGQLEPGGANITSAAGYYKINADISGSPFTYTAVKTDWGVIGDASPGGWDTSTDLTYDPASQTWQGVVRLNAGSFKFRANNGWTYNYGSNDGNEKLQQDGANISNDTEDDYAITLDLSKPNEYTYMANRWGLIGDATPGGWDTDTNMTWDAVNKVFTVTVDMANGQFKFRANDGWAYNLGGSLTALVKDGSNIDITAGNYTITLDPFTFVATVTKN